MANNTLMTRILLCNATTVEWSTSTKVLLKGEMALEFPESGVPKIKIGDGVNTFAALQYAVMTPAEVTAKINEIVVANKYDDTAVRELITALEGRVKVNEDAIAAINNETTGILAQAKADATEKVNALANGAVATNTADITALKGRMDTAEADIDALEGTVGTHTTNISGLTERMGAAEDAIEAVEGRLDTAEATLAKLDGDASTEGSVKKQLADAVAALEQKITDSEYDDTKVKEDIQANSDAIAAINNADTGILAQAKAYADGKDEAIAAAKKAGDDAQDAADAAQADVDALEAKVGEVAEGKTVMGVVAENAEAAQKYTDDKITALGSVFNFKGIVDTVEALPTEGMIAGNVYHVNAASAEYVYINGAWEELGSVIDLSAYITTADAEAKIATAKGEAIASAATTAQEKVDALANGAVADNTAAIAAEKTRAEGAEGALDTRLQAVEALVGEGGSVDDKIAAAKSEAISESNAYTDAEIDKVEATVSALDGAVVKGVKVQGTELTKDAEGKVDITSITTDALVNGVNTLVLNGGGAN